jgi:ELWxxDGT repeat protein
MARIFFTRSDLAAGTELWVSDGIAARRVKDILPGADSSWVSDFLIAGGKLFFAATDGVHGKEIWQSDGTDAGTVLVNPSRRRRQQSRESDQLQRRLDLRCNDDTATAGPQ